MEKREIPKVTLFENLSKNQPKENLVTGYKLMLHFRKVTNQILVRKKT